MRASRASYVVDAADPRAPSREAWDAMSADEREAVVASLPESPEPLLAMPPEGDRHRNVTTKATDGLGRWFAREGRRVYVSSGLATYYPSEPVFAPDVLAVTDVELHPRSSWIVSKEGKGLDVVVEVHVHGRLAKDAVDNVQRYARLGVTEYFLVDLAAQRLLGYRLAEPTARTYARLMPRHGIIPSRVLGLGLALEEDRVRFYVGDAPLPDADELIARLDHLIRDVLERRIAEAEDARRVAEDARRAAEDARDAEARARAHAETEVAELRARLAALEGEGAPAKR